MHRVGWGCAWCSAIGVVDVVTNPGAAVRAEHAGISPHCDGPVRPERVETVQRWTLARLVVLANEGVSPVNGRER